MACTYLLGTGFELGTVPFIAAYMSAAGVSVVGSPAHTGSYSLELVPTGGADASGQFDVAGTPSSIYISAWIYPGASHAGYNRVQVILADTKVIAVRLEGTHWSAYVDNVLVATGAYDIADLAAWHHLELYILIADSGAIQTRINGRADIAYSGDTKPAASSAIAYVRLLNADPNTDAMYVDDLAFGTGDWCGDVRFDLVAPDADSAPLEWTPSAGDNYACVDEVPASDADYVSAAVNGYQDLYEVAAWDSSGKEPLFVSQWTRADKDSAAADKVKQLLQSDDTLSPGSAATLVNGTPLYVYRILTTDPDTSRAWLPAAIAALLLGQEAVIA